MQRMLLKVISAGQGPVIARGGEVCKTVGFAYPGSNPGPATSDYPWYQHVSALIRNLLAAGSAAEREAAARESYARAQAAAETANAEYERRADDRSTDRSSPDIEGFPADQDVTTPAEAERVAEQLDERATQLLETQRTEEKAAAKAVEAAERAAQTTKLLDAAAKPLRYLTDQTLTGRRAADVEALIARMNSAQEEVREAGQALSGSERAQQDAASMVRAHANGPHARKVEESGPIVCVENDATFRTLLRFLPAHPHPPWTAVAWVQGRNWRASNRSLTSRSPLPAWTTSETSTPQDCRSPRQHARPPRPSGYQPGRRWRCGHSSSTSLRAQTAKSPTPTPAGSPPGSPRKSDNTQPNCSAPARRSLKRRCDTTRLHPRTASEEQP
jgi:hypothetical protein